MQGYQHEEWTVADPVFTGINHIGVVTQDLDGAVRAWADRYGVGPWSIYTKDPSNMRVAIDGRPAEFSFRVALAWISPTSRIEIIEPLDHRSPYARSLERHGGATHIHHVRLDVADYDGAAQSLVEDLGVSAAMHARFDGAPHVDEVFRCMYLDTADELGFLLEIGLAPPGFTMPVPESTYPPE